MRKTVSTCVLCDLLPCQHCTEEVYICDKCGAEDCEELYNLDGNEVCEDCFNEYLEELKNEARIKD